MEQKASRHNKGKLRYDLLEPYAIEQLTDIFTFGAEKYEDHNWLKGLKWSNITSSLKRHLAAYEKGEDYDAESGRLHAAHVAWNALALLSHYRYHPNLDDRNQVYYYNKRIGIDIDEVIADFTKAYGERTGKATRPDSWWYCYDIMQNFDAWRKDGTLDSFYDNIEPHIEGKNLGFDPVCYITSRPVDSAVTQKWLIKHGFPLKPVHTVTNRAEKVAIAKENKLDYFIDDNYDTFLEMNQAGVCCFLYDASHNQKFNVGYKRIKNFTDFKTRFL